MWLQHKWLSVKGQHKAGEDELWIREASSSRLEKYCGVWSGGLRRFTIGLVKLYLFSHWGWYEDGCPKQVVLERDFFVASYKETKRLMYIIMYSKYYVPLETLLPLFHWIALIFVSGRGREGEGQKKWARVKYDKRTCTEKSNQKRESTCNVLIDVIFFIAHATAQQL